MENDIAIVLDESLASYEFDTIDSWLNVGFDYNKNLIVKFVYNRRPPKIVKIAVVDVDSAYCISRAHKTKLTDLPKYIKKHFKKYTDGEECPPYEIEDLFRQVVNFIESHKVRCKIIKTTE